MDTPCETCVPQAVCISEARRRLRVIIGTDSLRQPLTGVGRYTFELCKRLMICPEVDAIEGFDLGVFHSLQPRLQSVEADEKRRSEGLAAAGIIGGLRMSLSRSTLAVQIYQRYVSHVSGLRLRRRSGDVFHSPNFHLPGNVEKAVITIHDLSHIHFPLYHPAARVLWMEKMVPSALDVAEKVICVSEATKKDVVQHFSIDRDKVIVTYPGVGAEFRPRPKEEIEVILNSYGLRYGHYFLCVSTLEPRKNIETLLYAFVRLDSSLKKRFPLVLVGAYGWKFDALQKLLEKFRHEPIIHLGFVSQTKLPILYSGAHCFVYPSFFEGFGLPVLEAQASGVPVICSNSSSLPEVASEKAILNNPHSVTNIFESLARSVEDSLWHEACKETGLVKAADFTWENCVNSTIAIYQGID